MNERGITQGGERAKGQNGRKHCEQALRRLKAEGQGPTCSQGKH